MDRHKYTDHRGALLDGCPVALDLVCHLLEGVVIGAWGLGFRSLGLRFSVKGLGFRV